MRERSWTVAEHPPEGRSGPTHVVGFSDETAHRREDLVTAAVESLAGLPGVAEAVHEDLEVILVTAPGVSTAALSDRCTSGRRTGLASAPAANGCVGRSSGRLAVRPGVRR